MITENLSPAATREIAAIAVGFHDEYVQRDHDYFLFTDDEGAKIARAKRGTDRWQAAMDAWTDERVMDGESDEPPWYEHLTGRRRGWTFTTFRAEIAHRMEEVLVSLAVHDYHRLVNLAVEKVLADAVTGDGRRKATDRAGR
jgi:hypothetical protein